MFISFQIEYLLLNSGRLFKVILNTAYQINKQIIHYIMYLEYIIDINLHN